jgi:hypothetical protein
MGAVKIYGLYPSTSLLILGQTVRGIRNNGINGVVRKVPENVKTVPKQ